MGREGRKFKNFQNILNDNYEENININNNSFQNKFPFKNMDQFYESYYYFTESINKATEKGKDLKCYNIIDVKWKDGSGKSPFMALEGFIQFDGEIDDEILSRKKYEKDLERKFHDFILNGVISDISIIEKTNKVKIAIRIKNNGNIFKNKSEFLRFMVDCINVNVSLISGVDFTFGSFEQMVGFLKPFFETGIGKILLSQLVDGAFYGISYTTYNQTYDSWFSNIFNLNPQQISVLNLVDQKPQICYIQSPPGTGKTTTAVSIICQNPDYKYLVTAESNKACDSFTEALYNKINHEISNDKKSIIKLNPIRIQSASAKKKNTDFVHFSEDDLFFSICKKSQNDLSLSDSERNTLIQYLNARKYIQKKRKVTSFSELAINQSTIFKLEKDIHEIFKKLYEPNVFITTMNLSSKVLPIKYNLPSPDVIIIDEANQITLWNFIAFASKYPNSRYILFGDPKQLRPYIPAGFVIQKPHDIFKKSIIEFLLSRKSIPKVKLIKSYRMHPEILKLPSSIFYNNTLLCGVKEESRSMVTRCLTKLNNKPICWFDTSGTSHLKKFKTSSCNFEEATYVNEFLQSLIKSKFNPKQIGVICLYKAQVEELIKIVGNSTITIDTVDSYQGNEKDIIVICTTLTSKGGSFIFSEFVNSPNRINVAVTRAKSGLFIFGDIDHMMKYKNWKKIGEFFINSNNIYHASEIESIFT